MCPSSSYDQSFSTSPLLLGSQYRHPLHLLHRRAVHLAAVRAPRRLRARAVFHPLRLRRQAQALLHLYQVVLRLRLRRRQAVRAAVAVFLLHPLRQVPAPRRARVVPYLHRVAQALAHLQVFHLHHRVLRVLVQVKVHPAVLHRPVLARYHRLQVHLLHRPVHYHLVLVQVAQVPQANLRLRPVLLVHRLVVLQVRRQVPKVRVPRRARVALVVHLHRFHQVAPRRVAVVHHQVRRLQAVAVRYLQAQVPRPLRVAVRHLAPAARVRALRAYRQVPVPRPAQAQAVPAPQVNRLSHQVLRARAVPPRPQDREAGTFVRRKPKPLLACQRGREFLGQRLTSTRTNRLEEILNSQVMGGKNALSRQLLSRSLERKKIKWL